MKILLFVLCLLIAQISFAQTPKKPRDKPPSKAEMEQLMKEVQQQMDMMSPEDKKQMEEMGIKMPTIDSKALENVTDADLAKGFEDANRIVPKKDPARIAAISKEKLTDGNIAAYLQKTHAKQVTKLDAKSKTQAEKLFSQINKKSPGGGEAANAAVGLWINGNYEMALYLMGKACLATPTNVDCLNNYAAFLTMTGGAELAMPILEKLKKAFPNNATVLNNLGQAWFALGDMDQADDYLGRCLKISPDDSQANLAKSLIEESKGNMPAAVDALKKSIKENYSLEKEQKLERLGYKLKPDDIAWGVKKKDDGLGMGRFSAPPRPKNVQESALLEPEWEEFTKTIDGETTKLKQAAFAQKPAVEKEMKDLQKAMIQNAQGGRRVHAVGMLSNKARIKWGYLMEENERGRKALYEEFSKASQQVRLWEDELEKKEKSIDKIYDPQIGEGLANPLKEFCEAINTVRNEYLEKSNGLLQVHYDRVLKHERNYLNDQLNYNLYLTPDKHFEQIKTEAKADWLSLLKGGQVQFRDFGPFCGEQKTKEAKKAKLANWEDFNCPSKTSMSVMCIGTMTFTCSKDTLEMSPCELPIELTYEKSNLTSHSSVEFFVGKDVGAESELGPVTIGVKAEGKLGGRIEIDKTGITDITAIAKGAVGVEASNEATNLKIGGNLAEGTVRYGMKSGPSGGLEILGR
jgi:Tfp pilus assembly protein PilF